MFFQAFKSPIQKAQDNKPVDDWAGGESSHTPVSTIYIFTTACGHFGPWSVRSLVTSVLRPNWTFNSVLGHFGPKDRTDLATLVLRKPKLTVYLYSVKYLCVVCLLLS